MKHHVSTVREAADLATDVAWGVRSDDVERRRQEHGENRLPDIQARSVWQMFVESLADKTLLILMGAAVLALGVEFLQAEMDPAHVPHYVDGVAILAAVLIASLVTTFNEARAARQFRLLSRERDDVAIKVLRDGRVGSISTFDLVVGDIVLFGAGDKLPADGLLLSGVDVSVDESTLTGESLPVGKGGTDLRLQAGTAVTEGVGRMLVTHVGAATEMGKLQLSLTETPDEPTPLQERLSRLADQIGVFGLIAAILTFSALAISFFARADTPVSFELGTAGELLGFMIIAVTIVVVAVPEGLPLAVTISLAYSVRKMAKENNLVRRLASCETMGAATVVCSDKTGTLTRNRMTVIAGWFAGRRYDRLPDKSRLAELGWQAFVEVASVNSTSFLEERDDGVVDYVGNPTECALLMLVRDWGEDYRARRDAAQVAHQFGFTSERKRMSTLVSAAEGQRLLVKGAPEVVLARSDRFVDDDAVVPLTESARERLVKDVEDYAREGYRTLAIAYRDLGAASSEDPDDLEANLVLVAVVAIADPVRPEVEAAVRECRRAGVEVKMVTGDNPLTATSISRQIGLLGKEDLVMTGDKFRQASDEKLRPILSRLRVLARSVPSDKLRLVSLLRKGGEVVAVTGDGTNDAPALKAADVGFSMGLTGTELAKEASDIVLLDDNFASIVTGTLWGRSIFENIRKFLQFQLTVNVVALTTAFFAAVFGFGIPLNTVQLLWVNLIMDTLAALALATEPPDPRFLTQPPHGRHAPLITRSMWLSILGTGAMMVVLLFAALWSDVVVPPETTHPERLTFVFNAFVLMQLFNEVNARSTRFDRGVFKGFFDSPLFVLVIGVTAVLQVLIVQYGGEFFRTVPQSLDLWLRAAALGLFVLLWGALLRSIGQALPSRWLATDGEFARAPVDSAPPPRTV